MDVLEGHRVGIYHILANLHSVNLLTNRRSQIFARRHAKARQACSLTINATSHPSDVFVLDFDGVICNSEPEVN